MIPNPAYLSRVAEALCDCCVQLHDCCIQVVDMGMRHTMYTACREGKLLLMAGAMDGSITLLDAHTGIVLARHKAHAKYCVRVRWAPDSCHCVSCSWDHTMSVFKLDTGTDESSLSLQKSETYLSQVQDVEFIPGAQPSDQLLSVALKNSNYLRLFDVGQLKVCAVRRSHVSTVCGSTAAEDQAMCIGLVD